MMQLLRFHFKYSKKMLLPGLVLAVGFSILQYFQSMELSLAPFTWIMAIYLPLIMSSQLLNTKFSQLMYTFPVSKKQFVQSIYAYIVLIFIVLALPVIIGLMYQWSSGHMSSFTLYFISGIFSYCLIATGGTIVAHFKQPLQEKPFSGSDAFFYVVFIGIGQTFIGFFFAVQHQAIFGVFIVPIICAWLFYRQYKKAVVLYEKAEFI